MKNLTKKQIHEIFQRFQTKEADPKIELNYNSPYELLVAVVLSAQATDKGVNLVTHKLFEIANTPESMMLLGEDGLKHIIKSIGLFNTKAKNIILFSNLLLEKYNGQLPSTLEELITLPGVGRKSANVILNCIYGVPSIAVDTHVFRVSNRMGFCQTKTPEATEMALEKAIPNIWKAKAHFWLVLHGRYTRKAKKPLCDRCIINDICMYNSKSW